MAEEVTMNKGGFGWNLGNTLGILGTLGAALGVGIPALVKANDAEDDNHRRGRRFDPENDVGYLHSKIYTDSQVREQQAINAAQSTKIALLEQANVYKDQINALQMQNMYQYVNGTFVKGNLFLPQTSIGQGLPPFPPIQLQPVPEVATSTSTTQSNG